MHYPKSIFILLLLLVCKVASAQQQVSGKVSDEKGQSLAGVSVIQQETKKGTTTDSDGSYSITVSNPGEATLAFSLVGHEDQTANVAGRATINIVLQKKDALLTDIVVVAYGTQKKANVTGAISTVQGKALERTQAPDLATALQGMSAGVNVTSPTGAPGTEAVVRIRGIGTLNNNNPLYIIDGVPVNEGLTSIAPSDIESISVLKDAEAAALYGARAANGVLLVTTKSGKAGKGTITLDASYGIANAIGLPTMMTTAQFIELQNEAFKNDGSSIRNTDDPSKLPNVNWLKETFKQGDTRKVNLSFSGGTDKSRYYIAGNVLDQTGTIVNSAFKRYGVRSNVTSNVKDWLKIGENLNITMDRTKAVGASGDGGGGTLPGVVRYALIRPNAIPVYDPSTGYYTDLPPSSIYSVENPRMFYGDGKNPLAIAQYVNNSTDKYRILGNTFAEAKIYKDLSIKTDLGLDFFIEEMSQYNGQIPGDRTILDNNSKSLATYRNKYSTLNWTNTVNYNHTWSSGHTLNAVAGTEFVDHIQDYLSASRRGFDSRADNSPDLRYLHYGTGAQEADGYKEEWALMSYFGRAAYNYQNKYILSATMRADQSSRFGPNNRTGYFPSVSAGWNISRESFLKNVLWLNNLKLRGSWGQLGNQEIGYYPSVSIFSTLGNILKRTTIGNPNVKWETIEQSNAGAELTAFNKQLTLSVDYFNKLSKDILVQLPMSFTNGDSEPPYENGAKMRNSGFDISAGYTSSPTAKLSWNVTANVTTLKNKVLSLYKSKEQIISSGNGMILLKAGEPIGSFYGYKTAGIFQNQAEIDAYRGKNGELLQPKAVPGDIRYANVNGDNIIDDKDRTIIGRAYPDMLYSLSGSLNYKNFDLNLFFNGVHGNQIYNEVDNIINSFDSRGFNTKVDFYNRHWHGEGTSNSVPRATYADLNNNRRTSDMYIENGSYLRLKNVVLGYNVPGQVLKHAGIGSARLYVSMQNVFTITKYTGMDPELYTNSNLSGKYGDLGMGIDMGTYPPARTFTFGIQTSF